MNQQTWLIIFYSIAGAVLGYLVSRYRHKYKHAAARALKFERAADAARHVLADCPRCCMLFNDWLRKELAIEPRAKKEEWPDVLDVRNDERKR